MAFSYRPWSGANCSAPSTMDSKVDCVPCVIACTMHAVVSPAFSLTRLPLHWLTFNASNRACHCSCNNHALQMRHLNSFHLTEGGGTHVSFAADISSRGHHKWCSFDANMRPTIGADKAPVPEPLPVYAKFFSRPLIFVNLCYRLACRE